METLLKFFSDLILFTAGVAVLMLWIAIIVVVIIEIHDALSEGKSTTLDEEDR